MMNKDIELLSSYLDGELSAEEIKYIEEKLSYTPELRDKFEELKRLRELTKSSIKKLPETPYFETRLFAHLEEKSYKKRIKRWFPVAAVTMLTLSVMLALKFNPDFFEQMVEEQKLNIAGFYKDNLKPLLFAADLTNEDIFNFAFNNQLPLDNERSQFIQLGSDGAGNEYFEINTAGIPGGKSSFEKFVKTLELNDFQKKQFDSIIGSYASALQSQILVNDKNTIAINQNLWNYQKAIAADVLAFAKGSSGKIVSEVMPVLYKVHAPVVQRMVHSVKTNKDNEYIFFTPDSLFVEAFEFNTDDYRREMELAEKDMKRNFEDLKKSKQEMEEIKLVQLKLDSTFINHKRAPRVDKNINIYIDSNLCRVHIDKITIPDIELPDMDSLEAIINEATKQVKSFVFTIPEFNIKSDKKSFKFDYKTGDSIKSYKFDVQIPEIPNVDSLIRNEMKHLENFKLPDGETGWNMPYLKDSLKWFNFFRYDDSTYSDNPIHFEFRMKEFEEEMQKFREEMEKLKMEIRKDTLKVRTKKPVEI